MAEGDFAACKALLFGLDPVAEDVARWHDQGFSFASGPDATFPYGLQQRNGGPCGVLASAQGWLIRRALFPDIEQELLEGLAGLEAPPAVRKATPGIEAALASGRDGTAEPPSPVTGAVPSQAADSCAPVAAAAAAATAAAAAPPAPKQAGGLAAIRPTTQGARLEALSFALAAPLWQAALAPTPTGVERPPADVTEGPRVRLVFPAEPGASPITAASDASKLRVVDVHSFEEAWSLLHAALPELGRSHGVMCLVYSALLTRGVATVKAEMDEADTALVARFGHCNQEVVSLFLTGSATSNPFDGERPLFEGSEAAGLAVRGVSRPPPVGYLTQLEAMRYTEVGSFFKNPTSPVWVVGSTSHFTVLFCTDLACNLPDPSMRARRVFDKHDTTSGGMVALEDVPGILGELNLPVASQPMQTRAVVARMDKGIGMAVWTDFWEATRKMLVTLPAGEAPLAIVDEAAVEASAKAAFTASDEFGGGFVQLERVPAVLRALGKPAPTSCHQRARGAGPCSASPARPPARAALWCHASSALLAPSSLPAHRPPHDCSLALLPSAAASVRGCLCRDPSASPLAPALAPSTASQTGRSRGRRPRRRAQRPSRRRPPRSAPRPPTALCFSRRCGTWLARTWWSTLAPPSKPSWTRRPQRLRLRPRLLPQPRPRRRRRHQPPHHHRRRHRHRHPRLQLQRQLTLLVLGQGPRLPRRCPPQQACRAGIPPRSPRTSSSPQRSRPPCRTLRPPSPRPPLRHWPRSHRAPTSGLGRTATSPASSTRR